MTTTLAVRRIGASEGGERIDSLTDLLLDCVGGGASISFMLPLERDKARGFWQNVIDGVRRGERTLVVAEDDEGRIVGTVQMITSMPDNQPHRADIAKLLVHRHARRGGVGQQLMLAIEDEARKQQRTVLVLDTASPEAERLYERMGWQRVGVIPNYALMPDGVLCATTYYYKQL
ncbi:GNAT family N-acetyltransferase [Massilia sp. ZL223]|uniref:GNAT family N-acetyltransferase n=1 Tax=Massilia sp. ZL223 TaxID=2824904 RepID=UPI001B82B205|nr:GNAT family N-acetyltransferase [Massilia sp. ZL223]MBQ5961664.1 GNAT family N-acetyltransferase [Massilia sp. ZL223]